MEGSFHPALVNTPSREFKLSDSRRRTGRSFEAVREEFRTGWSEFYGGLSGADRSGAFLGPSNGAYASAAAPGGRLGPAGEPPLRRLAREE